MTSVLRSKVLSQFACIGDKCEDTCCQIWSMQVNDATIERYRTKAPELLAAVESSKESPWIMRKDSASGFCVKLEGGLCGIHKKYGAEMLGDACALYPRITRRLGDTVIVDAALSCPEVVRQMLAHENPCDLEPATVDRLPEATKNYVYEGMTPETALAVHKLFIQVAGDASFSVEETFARIASVSRSIERVDTKTWAEAAAFYFKNVGMWLPASVKNPVDPFNLLHAMAGLIVATHKPPSGRLKQTLDDMEKALAVTLDWKNVLINLSDKSESAMEQMRRLWKEEGAALYDPVLRRYLQMQMADSLYPFAGLGKTLGDRITIIGVRLATIKLALMCSCAIYGTKLPEEAVVRVIQTISRILDHLGAADFSLKIYTETGWAEENRMRGLLEM
jgi:lysine-N-methylase